jgi:hypothetical protein
MLGEGSIKKAQIRFSGKAEREKKRGVPWHHGNMLPGNSFPQICVVSVNRIVDNDGPAQEYLRVVAFSNYP